MSEYIIQWDGIGTQLTELLRENTPPYLVSKRIRAKRRRERIVRCRDCKYYEPNTYSRFTCELLQFHVEPDGYCAWGERR